MPPTDAVHLGEFEQLVLLAVLRLGDDGYGMQVRREIETRTGRSLTTGAVYATLDRLEEKGLLTSTLTTQGRARRRFRVTAEGEGALRSALAAVESMTRGLNWRAS